MAIRVRDTFSQVLGELRHEPTAKRVRAFVGDEVVVDTTEAELFWEPRRVVPCYAVPLAAIRTAVVEGAEVDGSGSDLVGLRLPAVSERPVLDPSIPFAVHTTPGRVLDVGGRAGFAPAELPGYVALDFAAFDAWFEEERPTVGHPRDPFHRIDALPSTRSVRIEHDGQVLAESSRPVLVFETMLPTRFYLPRDDVRAALEPSPTRTTCAYKGHASYFTAAGLPDIAWSYPEPQEELTRLRDLVCFFDERLDVTVDGVARPRPVTPWS
ncbi:DUF427 domain-containing protein [Pseudonocardia sp. CA-107938]|uniref:DUF427 domain-containing protein n=1 Tax=Pseudonocardia sp. CA-107938 TaxID=3240021 RepID=UPI003D8F07E9